jgi:iron complex outermembrane recepter protein
LLKKTLFLILSIAGYSAQAQVCNLRLTGHVHSATHENLDRAIVTIVELNKKVVTNNRGDFSFDSLCVGNYTVKVVHPYHDSILQFTSLNNNRHLDIDLPLLTPSLSNITVTAQRGIQQTGIKKELSGRELEETRGQTLGEALSRLNGVTILQTGSNISKPVIHGLHGNRILTINNGVRQEGQQWGNEHAPEIDPFIANRLTVIKGVDELRYGSDAIGGVILVEPRSLRNTAGYSLDLNSVYFSNNRQYVFSGVYEQQFLRAPQFTFRLQGTYKRGANANTPYYRLNNTGNEEKNFSLSGIYRKNNFSSELYYSFFDTRLGIFAGSHIGNLTDLMNAINSDRPDPTFTGQKTYKIGRPFQEVQHHLLKSRSVYLNKKNQRFSLQVAAQFNDRKEYDVTRSSTITRPQLDLGIFTLTEDLTWESSVPSNFSRITGINGIQQQNSYSGRYFIPDYKSFSWGGYHIERWDQKNWDAQAGIRVDQKNITTNRLSGTSTVPERYEFSFTTFASSANLGHRFNEHWKMNATAALSSRAPHVNELLSNGIHHGTGTYEQGSIFLKPERSINLSWNNTFTNENSSIIVEASLYRNNISNFIFLQPKPEEPVLTIAGAFPKMVFEQADARLQGIDLSATFRLSRQMEWSNKYSLLRARNKSINDWLIRMPSDRVQSEMIFSFKNGKSISNSYISAEVVHVWEQTRVPNERNGRLDYKAPPPGYMLLNADISGTIMINQLPLSIGIGFRNILNTAYRDYMNNLRYFADETGRNIQVRIRIPFYQNL